jgi:hypothetical protein
MVKTTRPSGKATRRYEVQRQGNAWGVFLVTRDASGKFGPQTLVEGGFFDRRAAQAEADRRSDDDLGARS